MDPDAVLQALFDAVEQLKSGDLATALDAWPAVTDAVDALDVWIGQGGFYPAAWTGEE